MNVIGIGEKKTPDPFIVACDKFIYIEILKSQSEENESESNESKSVEKNNIDKITPKVIKLISSTIAELIFPRNLFMDGRFEERSWLVQSRFPIFFDRSNKLSTVF